MELRERNEILYSKMSLTVAVMGLLVSALRHSDAMSAPTMQNTGAIAFFMCLFLMYGIRIQLMRNYQGREEGRTSTVLHGMEVAAMIWGVSMPETSAWTFVFLSVFLIVIVFNRGFRTAVAMFASVFAGHLMILLVAAAIGRETQWDFQVTVDAGVRYVMLFFFLFLCRQIYDAYTEADNRNKKLLSELEHKYVQLEVTQEEIKYHYEKLLDSNNMLETANKKLTSSIAEFYTLQQIGQAINSIFDIQELIKYVNDIVIGVMGVNHSTILRYDDNRGRLQIQTTSMTEDFDLAMMRDHINCESLLSVVREGNPVIDNDIDLRTYPFARERDVRSIICIPLNTRQRCFGLIILEHRFINAFTDESTRFINIIANQVGIAIENAELYERLQIMATVDGLTGVYNRIFFNECILREVEQARNHGYELALAIFDIDHFKRFNDTYGHLFGDKVIREVADMIKKSLRSSDIVARYGGEEFVIIFPRLSPEDAMRRVELLRLKLSELIVRDELVESSVTASFGVSVYPHCAVTANELIRTADDALYQAKSSGRNCTRAAVPKTEISQEA